MMGGLGDLNKVMPEIMAMSTTTQTELTKIRELLEQLVEMQRVQLTVSQRNRMGSFYAERQTRTV
jgi:hypothetical protein